MQDNLYELIHSLTKSEKRHFKINVTGTGKSGQQKYIQLFDLLAGMESFDPEKIQKAMEWKDFSANYSMGKRYLYEKLLDGLSTYKKDPSAKGQIPVELQRIRVLVHKRLFGQARRKIARAKRLAYAVEEYKGLLGILEEERHLLVSGPGKSFKKAELDQVLEEMQFAINGLSLAHKVKTIHYRLFGLVRLSGGVKTEEDRQTLEECKDDLLACEVLAHPYLLPKIYHFNILAQYHFLRSDLRSSIQQLEQALPLFEVHPDFARENQITHISLVHNICSRALNLPDRALALKMVLLLGKMQGIRPVARARWTESYLSTGMVLLNNSGYGNENPGFIEMYEKVVDAKRPIIGRQFPIKARLDLCQFHFHQGRFAEALKRIQQVIQDPGHGSMRLFARLSPLMEMAIHLELGNFDWLGYRLQAMLKQVRSGHDFTFEKMFLVFIKGVLKANTKAEIRVVTEGFAVELKGLRASKEGVQVFGFFSFDYWIQARLKGGASMDVLREEWIAAGGPEVLLGAS